MLARKMSYFDFMYSHAESHRLRQYFGVHHRADRSDLHAIEHFTTKKLKRAIDVAHVYAQHYPYQDLPCQSVNQSVRGIPALLAIACHNLVFV